MRELRQRRSKGFIKQHLLWRVRDVIRAAHNVGDSHVNIIHNHTEMISRMPVRPQQSEIFNGFVLNIDLAKDNVVERSRLSVRHSEANEIRLTRCESALGLI